MMIVPLLTYSSTVDLKKTNGQLKLLDYIARRSAVIIADGKPVKKVQSEIVSMELCAATLEVTLFFF